MVTESSPDVNLKHFLPRLIEAFESVALCKEGDLTRIDTAKFAAACEPILDAFSLMGTVLSWAKPDFEGKRQSIEKAAAKFTWLDEIVDSDKKAGTLGVKDSNARNLHRLKCGVHFVVVMLEQLCSSKTITVRDAASHAYAKALQPIHNWAVQAAVQASLLTLPSREFFLKSIQETDETAAELAKRFAKVADPVVTVVDALYADGAPPPSSTWGASWGWGSG
mmetsp:Transcript_12435/g.34897  ORF Transcript_12435/g.34897 Transcript_12435/m.34897 type:complete len:222 (-) Transcript_12435:268-933(-)|eukprot:CAMPEP_0117680618 /NCGR_PEP_ID=MMETSP0804-20121206/18462_1 /TAXON_ID=1074897 /ORGANISM="Tetraselmis astigmatica, Strain CCMP880" /LENGTH=221 /DNA_ID=CAMNT_0005490155 /DNA_START=266 /DNA_END=931 /DNA_ORIENTATION=-